MNANRNLPPNLFTDAPELALRLAGILLAVAGLVAARFLKNPRLVMLIVPLWRKLRRAATRIERGFWPITRTRASQPGRRGGAAPLVRLPTGRNWLVRELGHEAAGLGLQLQHALGEPAAQALLAATPALGRLLRPFARMLGVAEAVTVVAALSPSGTTAAVYFVDEVTLEKEGADGLATAFSNSG